MTNSMSSTPSSFSTLQIGSLIEAYDGTAPTLHMVCFSTLQIGSLIEAGSIATRSPTRNWFQYPSNRVVDRSNLDLARKSPEKGFQYPSNRVVDRSDPAPTSRSCSPGFSTLQIGSWIEARPITPRAHTRSAFQYPSNRVVDRSAVGTLFL